jgi:membrane protein DedA with SNARE-associated domain
MTIAIAPHFLTFSTGILIMLVVLLPAVLFVAALVSILASHQTSGMKVVWVVFALCAPFLGPVLWFFVGRRTAQLRA